MNELLIAVAIICKSQDLVATRKCVLEYAVCADNHDYLLRRQSGNNKAINEQGLSDCVKSLDTANQVLAKENAILDEIARDIKLNEAEKAAKGAKNEQ